ncbi:hypothetical protein BKA58DRAFT_326912, partial [Alternaria rosae]|uniref:uncharacterized protein n=1 Tax=Alternaria rosae TaxID=1187941 RepID=UPI001E8DE82B
RYSSAASTAFSGRLSTDGGLFRSNDGITDPLLILHSLVPPLSLSAHTTYPYPLPSPLVLRFFPAATILAHPSGLSVFRTPLKSCCSLYTL